MLKLRGKKEKINKKTRFARFVCLFFLAYFLSMFVLSSIVYDNPQWFLVGQVNADIVNPFENEDEGDITDYNEIFEQFEGYVFISSGLQKKDHNLKLMAVPGQPAQIYRNFTIHIFTNQPCYYEIRIDDQVFSRGTCMWKSEVKTGSPYNDMTVRVTLVNMTNVSLPSFNFATISLLDNPWDSVSEGDGPIVVEPYFRLFNEGEWTVWVAKSIAVQILFLVVAIPCGMGLAQVHADLRGIGQVL